mmetsp:Transcript_44175/g.65496  ORF Transcript_44175/g.65496 Transcript_44175/m.65496 type:complete len:397 (-) Transcript_44175:86-1276(-)
MVKMILSTIAAAMAVSSVVVAQDTSLRHRRLQYDQQQQGGYGQAPPPDQQQQQQQMAPPQAGGGANMPYALPASAAEWCTPSILPPLPYEECEKKDTLNSVPLYGGLTNSLKIVLLGTILSFEEGRCLIVDESESELIKRKDSSQGLQSFINRYFEPIGLDATSSKVDNFKKRNKIKVRSWDEVWSDYDHNRRTYGHLSDIESLKYFKMEGHQLKRAMMRRMWRPLPQVRDATCSALANHGLQEEFITISIRQGDKKSEENFEFATMQQYVDEAERSIPVHFGGVVPKIFVATDDCGVLPELRALRPQWTFVSQCDLHSEQGFALKDMKDWSLEMTDEHFHKFFVELFAMASAKVFIGIWYTNVTWWAFFMRSADRTTFKLLDTPGVEDRESLDWW